MKLLFILIVMLFSCQSKDSGQVVLVPKKVPDSLVPFENTSKVIHIIVALCDNKYQGIVTVGAKIGNGQDPNNNLYWGCAYGIRTYFKKSAEWKFLKSDKKSGHILERIYFKHATKDIYLIADAYDGQFTKHATEDFLSANSGSKKETIFINGKTIGIYGNAQLVSYIGHNGLMDFNVASDYKNTDGKSRDCIILACMSRNFFKPFIRNANSNPLVWTTQLMAPEAYTIHDAISGYVLNETPQQIHQRAAKAYAKYQKCSVGAASKLLVTGF